MKDQVTELAKILISVESTKDNPEEQTQALNIARRYINGSKYEEFEKKGQKSLFAYNQMPKDKKFRVVLNAHLDVVPADTEQFVPYEKDGKIFGRGAYDMKAAAAVEILVFKELREKVNYPLGLQLVTDEETGGKNGTLHQLDHGITSEFVLVGEPTGFNIRNKSKGMFWLELTTEGEKAHAAYQWQGKNAINKMLKILNDIQEEFPVLNKEKWQTTVNISDINSSNPTYNSVADQCKVVLDARTIPESSEKVVKRIEKIIGKRANINFLLKESYYHTPENDPHIKLLQKKVNNVLNKEVSIQPAHGGCDLRHYKNGTKALEFGPIGGNHHGEDEWVDVESLYDYYDILKEFLLELE